MKGKEVNGEWVCTCDPSCDNCERRFRCLDAGVPLPKEAHTGKVAREAAQQMDIESQVEPVPEIVLLREELRGWRQHANRTESRLMEAEKLIREVHEFVHKISVGVSVGRRDAMANKLASFLAP